MAAPDFSRTMPTVPGLGQQSGPNAPPRRSIAGSVHSFDDNDGINPRNLLNSSNDRIQNCFSLMTYLVEIRTLRLGILS